MKKFIHFLLLFLVIQSAKAQKIDSLWTAPFKFEIQALTIAPDGTLIATTREQTLDAKRIVATILTAINPETGAEKWKFPTELTPDRINIKGIEVVPNTPFIIPVGTPLTVIDPYDGKILVDVTAEKISNVDDYGFLLESGHAWVSGTTDGDKSLSVFDLRTGKKLYSNTEFFKEKSKGAAKLNKLASLTGSPMAGGKGGPPRLLCKPINHGKDNMILATTNGIFHVNVSTGQSDWQAELPDPNKGKAIKVETDIDFVRLMPGRGETFFVIKAAYISAINYSDGKPAWKEVVKTSGPIDQIIYDQNGLILCPGSANMSGIVATGYLKLVDEKTGNELWGDGIKFNGGVKNYLYTEKGLAVAMVNSSNQKNSINFIDVAAGKFVLPKNITVDGSLQYMELTPKGLLFKTDREVNIIGLETDKPLMKLPVQSKGEMPMLLVNGPEHVYFYSNDDKAIYDINKIDGTGKMLNKEKIDFKGGEQPTHIDLRREGVLVYSGQNAVLIALNGDAKYSLYNPGVRTFESVMNKASAYADAFNAVATLAGSAVAVNQINKSYVQLSGSLTVAQQAIARNEFSQLQQAYGEIGTADFIMNLTHFKNVKSRLTASADSKNSIYMMTKIASDDRSGLLGINKDSGQPVSKVMLAKRDKEPLYELDTESGFLYYAPKGSNVVGWSTTPNAITAYRTPSE